MKNRKLNSKVRDIGRDNQRYRDRLREVRGRERYSRKIETEFRDIEG